MRDLQLYHFGVWLYGMWAALAIFQFGLHGRSSVRMVQPRAVRLAEHVRLEGVPCRSEGHMLHIISLLRIVIGAAHMFSPLLVLRGGVRGAGLYKLPGGVSGCLVLGGTAGSMAERFLD